MPCRIFNKKESEFDAFFLRNTYVKGFAQPLKSSFFSVFFLLPFVFMAVVVVVVVFLLTFFFLNSQLDKLV